MTKIVFILAIRAILIIAVVCFIQYLLAKRANKLLGTVIPMILFVFSLIFCAYTTVTRKDTYKVTTSNHTYEYKDEAKCMEKQEQLQNQNIAYAVKKSYNGFSTKNIIGYFFGINVIAVILLMEYFFVKKRYVRRMHMEIRDL
ncbi:hypothetical protein [[Clostridium] polysaccharolyticum]|uniref:Uncharacterized protein n=1 Tax=[Clostridium] polysaccharolyticum TaxID=29364 RepID=A0A1I0BPC9_9FIRM|nr:hypothetical protein [[Clostridium] polysaccharolyticum]SET08796.1 hypothetical protein SAMN04487772_10837 [[Clostridium] polysaccharolyticum]